MVAVRRVAVAVALSSSCCRRRPFAQVTTADIVGRVTDASGAVLPGVTVTVENVGTHDDARRADRRVRRLRVQRCCRSARYTVTIELQGFTSQTATRDARRPAIASRLDAKLQVGAVAENITVTAESPLVQTDTSTRRARS